jgi:4-amino-4-deoxy-L-arabinose transferase-like glycosyltransferase
VGQHAPGAIEPMHAVLHPLPLVPARATRVHPLTWTLAATTATVFLWVAAAAFLNDSQLQDSLEQFVWGRGFEWGYWKHPPLTSWIMWTALQVLPATPLVTYGLAAVFGVATIWLSALLAQRLFGTQAAIGTALLLTLHYGFTRRGQVYNHNTVLVACVALAALLVLVAVQRDRPRDWVAAGMAAGLAILAKYQAVLPLAGLLLAVAAGGDWRRCRGGLALAAGVALLVVAPHAIWVVQQDFTTLRYAAHYVEASGLGARGERSASFMAMQGKYFLPAACFLLVLWATSRGRWMPRPGMDGRQRAWLVGLVVVPPVLVLLAALAGGVRLQSHWGLQTTQFLAVGIAVLLLQRFGPWGARHTLAWAAVQAVALALFIGQGLGHVGFTSERAAARALPAASLARQVQGWWRGRTGCELDYLSGDVSMAGMLAAYAGRPVRVLEDNDPFKSPWIDLAAMQARGWIDVQVGDMGPSGGDMLVLPLAAGQRRVDEVAVQGALVLQAHPPQVGCGPD